MHRAYDVAITLLCICYRVYIWLGSTMDEVDNDVGTTYTHSLTASSRLVETIKL